MLHFGLQKVLVLSFGTKFTSNQFEICTKKCRRQETQKTFSDYSWFEQLTFTVGFCGRQKHHSLGEGCETAQCPSVCSCKMMQNTLSDSVIQHTIHRFGGYLDMTFFHMKRKENECAQNHPPSLKSLPRVLSNQPNFSPTFTAEHGKPTPVVSCHLSNVIFITHLIRVITLFLV